MKKTFSEIINTNKTDSEPYDRIVCNDGESVSIQVGEYLYCVPRINSAPWFAVEAGFPSCVPPDSWKHYADNWHIPITVKLRNFRFRILFSAQSDYIYCKTGNKYINFIKGLRRGIKREWPVLIMPSPCNTIYGYIPVEVVQEFIDKHGGEKNG